MWNKLCTENVVSTLTTDERVHSTLTTMNLTFGETEIMTKETVAKDSKMYFDRFPKGQYIACTKNYKLVSDLFRRIKIKDKIINEASLYTEYFVSNGEGTEDIAMKHFGSLITLGYTNIKRCNRRI